MTTPVCNALIPDNRLYGTTGSDQVRISKADGADGLAGKFKVEINGQVRVMDKQELLSTRFELGAGNDTVTIDAGLDLKPGSIAVNGGSGTMHLLGDSSKVDNVTGKDNTELPKPFRIPGTMLVVTPLEAAKKGESLSLFGMELPFKSARITNESCFTSIPAMPKNAKDVQGTLQGKNPPPGQPTGQMPQFSVVLSADKPRVDVNGKVPLSLHPATVPGTPLNGKIAEGNVMRNELINPSIALGERMVLTGTLSLRDPYPAHYVSPTELNITLTSEKFKSINPKQHGDKLDIGQVGKVHVEALGVAGAKGNITMSYDLTRIDDALKPLNLKAGDARAMRQEIVDVIKSKFAQLEKNHSAIDLATMLGPKGDLAKSMKQVFDKYVPADTKPSKVEAAIKNVLAEVTHPGVTVKGPMYMGVPLGYGYISADSTRPTRAPLDGSGIGLPHAAKVALVGPTMIPAGVLSEIATPAFGGLLARDWDTFALSASIAGKPTLEPGSIGVAGVAAVRGGFRLGGFDVTAEAGWRGRASLNSTGGGAGAKGDQFRKDFDSMQAARGAAERKHAEKAEGHERGVHRPDLDPPQVTGNDQPKSEVFIGVKVRKTF